MAVSSFFLLFIIKMSTKYYFISNRKRYNTWYTLYFAANFEPRGSGKQWVGVNPAKLFSWLILVIIVSCYLFLFGLAILDCLKLRTLPYLIMNRAVKGSRWFIIVIFF